MKKIVLPLAEAARKFPKVIAVVSDEESISYQELDQRVRNIQPYLESKNVKSKNRVASLGNNTVEQIIFLWALWRIGAVACLLNARWPKQAIGKQIKKLHCSHFIKEKSLEAEVRNVEIIPPPSPNPSLSARQAGQQGRGIFLDDRYSLSLAGRTGEGGEKIALNQLATILLTSGSSADPKAVVHTFGNHYFNAKGSQQNIPLQPGDRWLLSLPLYHVSGLSILFRTVLAGAGIVVAQAKEDWGKIIRKQAVTHVSLVPTQLFRLLQEKKNIAILRNLKTILLGGGPIPEGLIKQARRYHLPVRMTYGLTEMGSQVATSKEFLGKAKVLKYRRVRISPQQEILVKGETLFKGYYERGKMILSLKRGGWFATGDLGTLDKQGSLTVKGRKDNMFISGGENIYPEEIEKYLLEIKGMEEAVVAPMADAEFGQRPAAFIKVTAGKGISQSALRLFLQSRLPSYKIPQKFFIGSFNSQWTGMKINRQDFVRLLQKKFFLKELP